MESLNGEKCVVCKDNYADGITTDRKPICFDCLFKDVGKETDDSGIPVIQKENVTPKKKKPKKKVEKQTTSLEELF